IINNGTLVLETNQGIGTVASIAQSSLITVEANGTLDISLVAGSNPPVSGGSTSIKSLDGSGVVNLGTNTLILTGASSTFAGIIGIDAANPGTPNPGGLTLLAGTEVLVGNNVYTGTTTISGGTLQLGNGGTTGSIAGAIVNNAVLAVNHSNTVTIAG